jgi:polysaccharide deacetylase 2 family uncharacterized protein YibQ
VSLILACALATGIALGCAYDAKAYDARRLDSFASISMQLPESWKAFRLAPPQVLMPVRMGNLPSWLFGKNEETKHKTVDDGRPVIAVVVDDLGVDAARTGQAIALPPQVTLSFLPYPKGSRALSHKAHEAGHQVMVHLQMQPVGGADPGPNALSSNLSSAEIARRVEWALGRVSDYEGANNHMGSRFTTSRDALTPVMRTLSEHKMFFLDSRTTPATQAEDVARATHLLTGSRDVFLDDEDTASAVERQLRKVEAHARATGNAIAIGHPHPKTLAALKTWTATLEKKGFRLAPVSRVLEQRAKPQRLPLLSSLFN